MHIEKAHERGLPGFGLSGTALDAAVATSFAKIMAEDSQRMPHCVEPGDELSEQIRKATREETLGLLLHVLRRWHQLK